LFLQRSQFTEESGKLCNDGVAVFVMDVCYCFVDACYFISFWRGLLYYCAAFCTVWDYRVISCTVWDLVLLLRGISYCCVGSCTTVPFLVLVLYGISYYCCMGSCTSTVSFLVLCGISYRVESRSKPNGQRSMAHSNARWCTQPALLTYHYCAMYDCLIRYGRALECAIERWSAPLSVARFDG